MRNDEIPSNIWALKNDLVEAINHKAESNNYHYQYKQNWSCLGAEMIRIGEKIQELAAKYEQPKEDC